MSGANVTYVLSLKDMFTQQIKDAERATNKLEQSVNKTQISLGGIGKLAAGAFAGIGLANVVTDIVQTGAKFDQYEVGLATLLKSQEKASEAFKNIKEDAAKTPFDTESLIITNRALIAAGAGADEARKATMDLGNAIAAVGGGNDELTRMAVNMQQIKNTGKATALDIKQFAFAGIPIYSMLADAMGKNVEEIKDMDVSYDMLTYTFAKARAEGGMFFHALENQAESTAGKMSNLSERITFLKDELYEGLKPAIVNTLEGFSSLLEVVKEIPTFIEDNSTAFWGLAAALAGVATGLVVYNGLMLAASLWTGAKFIGGMISFAAAIKGVTVAQWALNGATAFFAGLTGVGLVALAAAGMAVLAVGIYAARDAQDELNGSMKETLRLSSDMGKGEYAASFGLAATNINTPYAAVGGYGDKDEKDKMKFPDYTGGGGDSTKVGRVSGSRSVNVTITIGKMIEKQIFNTKNLHESKGKIKEEVERVLMAAVNDASNIAYE